MNREKRDELKRTFNVAIDEIPEDVIDNIEGHILMLYTSNHPTDPLGGFLSTFSPNIRQLSDPLKFSAIIRLIKDLAFIDQVKMNNLIANLSRLL